MIDTDTMEAGREMDAMIARRVMKWRRDRVGGTHWRSKAGQPHVHVAIDAWHPSSDIAAAWRVVEHFTERLADLKDGEWALDRLGYRCCAQDGDGAHGEWRCYMSVNVGDTRRDVIATGDTAPLAICRAVLAAVAVEPEPRT